MGSYLVYIAGGALATSFADNNKWLKGLSWVLTLVFIGLMYKQYG